MERAGWKVRGTALAMAIAAALLLPREGRVSGAAHGTITRADFAVTAVWGPRIHFRDPDSEREHHAQERKAIEAALTPLADRIEAFLKRLKAKPPWDGLLQPYAPTDAGTSLAAFELADHRDVLAAIQARGPYLYETSFPHQLPGRGQASVHVRLVLQGAPELTALHALEDGLFALRTPMPADDRDRANAKGIELHAFDCDGTAKKLERIRSGLTERLEAGGLMFRGHEQEGCPFTATLEGPGLCRVELQWLMTGRHHWGRSKAVLVAAVQAVLPEAREWPGFPPSQEADQAPWRMVFPLPPD